jgi:hypothetical protein
MKKILTTVVATTALLLTSSPAAYAAEKVHCQNVTVKGDPGKVCYTATYSGGKWQYAIFDVIGVNSNYLESIEFYAWVRWGVNTQIADKRPVADGGGVWVGKYTSGSLTMDSTLRVDNAGDVNQVSHKFRA